MLSTFFLTCIAWVFFRAEDLHQAFAYLRGLFSTSLFSVPRMENPALVWLLAILLGVEWIGRTGKHGLEALGLSWSPLWRWAMYAGLLVLIGLYSISGDTPFIYFQF